MTASVDLATVTSVGGDSDRDSFSIGVVSMDNS